ncbi:MAG: hypothetical protein K9N52_10170, partial [Verrucomicrobia bacterium]|nr:hypothetical protein [Verrucomicrobiota bacterium]
GSAELYFCLLDPAAQIPVTREHMPEGYVFGAGVLLKAFLMQLVDPGPEAVAANTVRRFLEGHIAK